MHAAHQRNVRGMIGLGLLLWVAASPGNVVAVVHVSATTLEVSGDWMETWYTHQDDQTHNASDTFHHSTVSDPSLSASVSSSPFGWGTAGAAISALSLSLQADSASASIPYDWGMGCLSPTYINIYATATTRFQAAGSFLEIAWSGFADFNYGNSEQELALLLKDVTTATTLLALTASPDWSPWQEAGFNVIYQVAVDPVYEYELVLSGWITAFDAKHAELNSHAQITVISEPASALLLLGGAFFILIRRLLIGFPRFRLGKHLGQ